MARVATKRPGKPRPGKDKKEGLPDGAEGANGNVQDPSAESVKMTPESADTVPAPQSTEAPAQPAKRQRPEKGQREAPRARPEGPRPDGASEAEAGKGIQPGASLERPRPEGPPAAAINIAKLQAMS